jgi:ABC-type multidrug transport system ATPase subunit
MNNKIAIAWIDLNFSIKSFLVRNEKLILNNLNGSINFGSLNALMGPSGAGKTTLLKCINGKNKFGLEEKSKIYLNSSQKIRSCLIGNNEKERLVIGLTAKQNLIYASKLKNSGKDFNISHENNVNNLLSELMTSDIADNKVEFCSGGEKRRLLIALELTSRIKPNLLCIDEPTSGLDSYAAEGVNNLIYFIIN